MRSRPVLLVALLLGGALAAGGAGIATGAIGIEETTPPAGPTITSPLPMAQRSSGPEQAAFAILRREPSGIDALPASTAADLANSYSVKAAGMNTALARRAVTDAGAVWVVPGNGSTCLITNVTPVPPGGAAVREGAAGCLRDDDATAGKLVTSSTLNATKPPHELIAGLVPDGVDRATVQRSDGSIQSIAVHDNVYTAELDGLTADAVKFAGPSGETVVHP